MNLEKKINSLNEHFFFKEFTYSNNKFKSSDGQEREAADSIVYLDEISFVFQVKERNKKYYGAADDERKWFKRNILKRATKQIRDTISYICGYQSVVLENNRGHSFEISSDKLRDPHKIVIHKSSELLPRECLNTKFHISKTVGVIHILQERDYLMLTHSLLTPSEVSEYFLFRAGLIDKHNETLSYFPEMALLGQYLSGREDEHPSVSFIEYLQRLNQEIDSWDMTGIIKVFHDRITCEEGPTDYYFILKELAKLMRNELVEFKERFMLSWEACKKDDLTLPYRFMLTRTNCSFVFIPILREHKDSRHIALTQLTCANKHDMKSLKAIGVSFVALGGGYQDVEWCFVEKPWEQNKEFDDLLKNNFPFREVSENQIDRYEFK